MIKVIKLGLTLALCVSALSACGKPAFNLNSDKSPIEQAFSAEGDDFGVLGFGGSFGGMKGHHGSKGGFGAKFLNLTDDQKKKFQELTKEAHDKLTSKKPNFEEIKKVVKEAFLSEKFDKASLKTKLEAFKPNEDEMVSFRATQIVKGYAILTDEQKKKLEEKMNEAETKFQAMKDKFSGMKKGPKFFGPEKMIDKISSELGLTEEQKTKIKALFSEKDRPDPKEMFEKMKKVQTEIKAELKGANPSIDKVKEILKANKPPQDKMDKMFDKVSQVHDILNAEQRQKLVDKMDKMMGQHKGFGKGPKGGHGFFF